MQVIWVHNTMNNEYISCLSQLVQKITKTCNTSLALFDNRKKVICSTDSCVKYDTFHPIYLNGNLLAYLAAPTANNNNRLRLMKRWLEESINNDFTKNDMAREIAGLWQELNFFYGFMNEISPEYNIRKICTICINKVVKIKQFKKAHLIFFNEDNEIDTVATDQKAMRTYVQKIEKWVFQTQTPLILNELKNLPDKLKTQIEGYQIELPFAVVPLATSDEVHGILSVWGCRKIKTFLTDDIKLLTAIGLQIGMIIKNFLMVHQLRSVEGLTKELELAAQIQRNLIPDKLPVVPGILLDGRCIPANDIGGDYYDVIEHDNSTTFIIADVSGHGIASALFMTSVRSALRTILADGSPLTKVAGQLNQIVNDDAGASGMFVTLFLLRYFHQTKMITYVNCGQTPPLFFRKEDASFIRLETGGVPIGFIDQAEYGQGTQKLKTGDLLILHTDGFIESSDSHNRRFEEERFMHTVRMYGELPPDYLIDKIFQAVYRFMGNGIHHDDMTILVLKKEQEN